ncbi:MAG: leucine-rich repeat protein [Oscillospiraceae bacterium]|nr:leucine-rich repeat protein [Oscillospiraceae bacterium]
MYCYYCMAETKAGDGSDNKKCGVCGKEYEVSNQAGHLKIETKLNGQFTIGRVLGQGGFGITYVGRDETLQMRIAIKEYYPQGYAERDDVTKTNVIIKDGPHSELLNRERDGFLREARILAQFDRESSIVHVKQCFELNNTAYIIMDFVNGISLEDYLKENGTIEPKHVVEWFLPVLQALEKVHNKSLIHRDISPDNILVEDGRLILIDFGAARSTTEKKATIMLKPGYAPQEQYNSDISTQGPWTDVYAVCATMYHCITGEIPPAANPGNVIPRPSEKGIEIPAQIEKALMRGLSYEPKDRQQSMSELIRELTSNFQVDEQVDDQGRKTILMVENDDDGRKTVLMQTNATEMMAGNPAGAGEKQKKKWLIPVIAACAILLAGGIGGIALARNKQPETQQTAAELSSESEGEQTSSAAADGDTEGEDAEASSEGEPPAATAAGETLSPEVQTTATDENGQTVTAEPLEGQVIQGADGGTADGGGLPNRVIGGGVIRQEHNNTPQQETPAQQQAAPPAQVPATQPPATQPPVTQPPATQPSDYTYSIWNGGCLITGLNTALTSLNIPSSIHGLTVLGIGDGAFSGYDFIQSVYIPNTVTYIGNYAFQYCTGLRSVTIPSSVRTLGQYVFEASGVDNLVFENGITDIGNYSCYGMEYLEKIIIPSTCTRIGDYAFGQCEWLETICIPTSVTQICLGAFNCYPTVPADVYYGGSSAQWNTLDISSSAFPAPTMYYNVRDFQYL